MQGKLSGFMRCFTVMSLYAAQRNVGKRPRHSTCYALDEFVHAGRLDGLLTAAGGFRKFGIRLLTVAQTINQIKAVYPQSWSDFLGTAECVIWAANGDLDSREYLSKLLGMRTKEVKVSGGFLSSLRPHPRREDRVLMSPGQLRDYLQNNIIVTFATDRPLRLKPAPYYKVLPVSWYAADRFYGEKWARALTRRVLGFLRSRRTP
jgi:type IV secretory pathway TraG/TraD family ATPase VirD4